MRDSVKSAIAVTDAAVSPDGVPRFDERKARMGGEYGQRAFATTSAVVMGLLLIIVADALFAVVFNIFGW